MIHWKDGLNGTGTLKNLAALLDASNLPADSKKDVNRVEDFLQTVTEGYVVTAAMSHLGMTAPDATPSGYDSRDPGKWMLGLLEQLLTFIDYQWTESKWQQAPPPLVNHQR